MKRIRSLFNKTTSSPSKISTMISKPKATSTANRYDKEMDGDLLCSRTAAGPTTGMTLSKLRSSSPIHPNLRSMCIRNSSSSFRRTMSDSSPLSFIEEPLCAYLSLFDGTEKDMTDVQIYIIDNLFSDNFLHMMDGDMPIDKAAFIQINKQMLKQGIVATLEDINFVDEYNVEYTVHWYYKENSRVTHVSALVVDQKIVKLEPCAETRSAFANNMMFSSWKNAKDSRNWLGDLLPKHSNSDSTSTASSIEESLHSAPTILPKLDQDQKKKKEALAEENKVTVLESTSTSQDNKKFEAKSTIASMVDEELVESQELTPVNDEVYGVNQDEDEQIIEKRNNRSSKQPKVKGRRWLRAGGRRKKK